MIIGSSFGLELSSNLTTSVLYAWLQAANSPGTTDIAFAILASEVVPIPLAVPLSVTFHKSVALS